MARYAVFTPPLTAGRVCLNVVIDAPGKIAAGLQELGVSTYCEPGATYSGAGTVWTPPVLSTAEKDERGVAVGGVWILDTPSVRAHLAMKQLAVLNGDTGVLPFALPIVGGGAVLITATGIGGTVAIRAAVLAFSTVFPRL